MEISRVVLSGKKLNICPMRWATVAKNAYHVALIDRMLLSGFTSKVSFADIFKIWSSQKDTTTGLKHPEPIANYKLHIKPRYVLDRVIIQYLFCGSVWKRQCFLAHAAYSMKIRHAIINVYMNISWLRISADLS